MTGANLATPARIQASYAWCETVARKQAKNFYYSFLLLAPEQRHAMCAVYAFMRYCDDLSDDEGLSDRAAAIARWHGDLDNALRRGVLTDHPVWPAFVDTVRRYRIPHQYFFDMIAGVNSDLEPRRIQSFEELYRYCYHVASVVGLTIIHIFGFESSAAPMLAEKCGVAFQLTNIIRDVKEDRGKDRVYLPAEDFQRFGVSSDTFEPRENFRAMLEFEAGRAREYYRQARPLIGMVQSRSRPSLRALIAIYSALLDKIAASDYDVLGQRVSVPAAKKVWLMARSLFA